MSNIYTAGLNNVGSYQVSGIPYLSGGIDASGGGASLTFPYVTRWIQISNSGSPVVASIAPDKYGAPLTWYEPTLFKPAV